MEARLLYDGGMSSMVDMPSDPKKIRTRLRNYERKLAKEKEELGVYRDGAGKRYFVAPLYMLLHDQEGALRSFAWYEQAFSDDIGESGHYLCWALALLRSGAEEGARAKLRCCMFANRYTLPKLLGLDPVTVGVHPDPDGLALMYLEDIPDAYYELWNDDEKDWATNVFHNDAWARLRARFYEIETLLKDEPRGLRRSALVDELFQLQK